MRGQVFTINGTTFFTMGGGASHDIQDGILDPDGPDFERKYQILKRRNACFRVKGLTWWAEEMPSDKEYAKARANLEKAGWKVDCIVTHCCPTNIAAKLNAHYEPDRLTDFLEEILRRCKFDFWFFGHYHDNRMINERFILQWEQISELSD